MLDVDPDTAHETAELVTATGAEAIAVGVDIGVETEVRRAVASVVEHFGALDVAVNNAVGPVDHQMLHEFDVDDARRMIDVRAARDRAVHQTGARRDARGSWGSDRQRRLHRADTAVNAGTASTGRARSASRRSRVAANENGSAGIRVNAVAAGAMLTPTLQEFLDAVPGSQARIEATVPLRHVADPAEVADAALFLASDLARYVTGTVLFADGGGILHGSAFESTSGS